MEQDDDQTYSKVETELVRKTNYCCWIVGCSDAGHIVGSVVAAHEAVDAEFVVVGVGKFDSCALLRCQWWKLDVLHHWPLIHSAALESCHRICHLSRNPFDCRLRLH